MCSYKQVIPILLLAILSMYTYAQEYQLGVTYQDSEGYIEYTYGNLPLIISIPHGGDLKPAAIPDRNCDGCVTGCVPHVIINKLHRTKLDANRDLVEGADGDPIGGAAWIAYHDYIKVAQDSISAYYDRGLFLDLHGHDHTIQRVELGYLLSHGDLQLSDAELDTDTYTDKCSVRHLAESNVSSSLSELVRGEGSLGHELVYRTHPTVPSPADLFPLGGEPYFSGGYNTAVYGSRDSGSIDAIQIECNSEIRFDSLKRVAFADNLARAIREFQIRYYDTETEPDNCFILASNDEYVAPVALFPNPAQTQFKLTQLLEFYDTAILDQFGRAIYDLGVINSDREIDISNLAEGSYFVRLQGRNRVIVKKLLVLR